MTSQEYTSRTPVNFKVEATWKQVIEIDVRAIDARLLQLEDYRERTQNLCDNTHENIQPACQNVMQIAGKDIAKLKLLIERFVVSAFLTT